MADSVTVTNLPNPGSKEAVALELWRTLRHHLDSSNLQKELDLFAQCLNATHRASYNVSALT